MHTQRRVCSPAALAARLGAAAHAAVTADEAKALGTTLTADRRREGRQQGRHHSRLHRRPDHAAGRLQGRRRHPPEPVRRREAASARSTPRTWRSTRDKLTEGTKALLKKYPTFRIDVYPTHRTRRVPEVRRRQHREERGAGEDAQRRPLDRGRARRLPVPDPEDRLRGDVEPPGALQRPGLRGQVPQPERRRQRPRRRWPPKA